MKVLMNDHMSLLFYLFNISIENIKWRFIDRSRKLLNDMFRTGVQI